MTLWWHCNEQEKESLRGFLPSSSQRLWDFFSLANIWLSWKCVILSMRGVLLELSGTSALISLSLCKVLLPSCGCGHSQSAPAVPHGLDGLALGWQGDITPSARSHPHHRWISCVSLLFFPILTPNSFSLVYWMVVWTCSVGFRASAVFLWDFPPTVCGSAHLELLLQVLSFKIEVSSKTCRTNCDLGVKKEAVSSIWLPGKYSLEEKDFLPHLLYI